MENSEEKKEKEQNINTSERVVDARPQSRWVVLITCAVGRGQRGRVAPHPLARQSLSGDGDGGGGQGLGALGVIYSLILEQNRGTFQK